jgi:hypothetical protein
MHKLELVDIPRRRGQILAMDPGSPPLSRPRLWARRILRGALVLVAAGLFLPPLLVRGPVLRWIVARATRDLCGTVALERGHVSWLVVPELLRGRPFAVELRGLRMVGPDGHEALFVERVTAEIEIDRNPWRFVVDPALVERGRWRLAVDAGGGLGGFLGVFRPVPAGETRAACLAPPAPRRGPRRAQQVEPNASVVVRRARLEDIDVDLDFPVWGLSLPHARATGGLALGTPGGPLFTFEVRDARAPGGMLRAGLGGAAANGATTTAHFDGVVISRVGVSADEPADLVLEVARGDTGRSRLSGKAVFENVFAHHGRDGQKNPPGLSLDARWERLADAAARLEAPWLPREALGEILDGTLAAHVRGPFLALSGALSVEGPRAGLEATVEHGQRAAVDVRTSDLALAPFLHESLKPLLAGRLTGHLRAKLELGHGLRNADLEIPSADVTLVREGANREPPRIAFRVGTPAHAPVTWSEADDTLVFGLEAAQLAHRSLRLEGLFARWAELSARGALTLDLPPATPGPDAVDPPAHVDAKVSLAVTSLARWVPPATASARVAAAVTLAGPLDHLRARLVFAPPTTATIFGERFRAPTPVTATLDESRVVTLDGLAIERVGGGRLEARGRAERGGAIAGRLRLAGYPLGAIPGLESVVVPAAIGGGRPSSLRDALAGTVDADLAVAGRTAQPAFTGTLALARVGLARVPLGDGQVRVRARGWTLDVEGTLGPSLALRMGATRARDGVTANADLRVHDLALAPWLPPALSELGVVVSGDARVAVAPHRPFATRAELDAVGGGSALRIAGETTGDQARASASGRVELAGLRPLWREGLDEASGAINVDVRTAPGLPVAGTLVVARTLSLRPRGWPLAFAVAEGGRLDVDRTHVHVPGLVLEAPGARLALAGDVAADLITPERSTVDLTASARVDAATLARQAHLPGVASASGTITIDGRARGAVGDPDAHGKVHLDGVEVRLASRSLPALRVDGVVDAAGHELSTQLLRVETLGPAAAQGIVTIGAPGTPASATLGGWPLRVERVDAPLAARGLRVGDAKSPFEIGALDLRLRLTGDPDRELLLSGDVGVTRARFDPFGGKKKAAGPARPWFESLPPHLTLDLTLHGPGDAVVVDVPVLPDVDLGFRCRVVGNARGGTISGEVRGRGAYSRLMLALFGPKGARECRLLKE